MLDIILIYKIKYCYQYY